MEFASDYVLEEEDVYEQVSDDEYDRGMSVSDSDSEDDQQNSHAVARSARGLRGLASLMSGKKRKEKAKKSHWKQDSASKSVHKKSEKEVQQGLNKRWFRRADTNVASVKLDTLLSPGNMHAGEAVQCSHCGAVLSHISQLQSQEEEKIWNCDFCDQRAVVDLEEEEIPQADDVTFLLEPAMTTTASSLSGLDQSLVIFVMDISGSMCVTTEVAGTVKLRGTAHLERLHSFNLEDEDQFLPSQRSHNVTYISRLQAMQAAVDHQLEEMAQKHPSRRVGLVAFNNEVNVIGDGSQSTVTFAGDKLTNSDQLVKEASDLCLTQPIQSSRKLLGEKIYKLEEGGATALGPALVIAVSIAKQHAGSKVILCTDGKANIGLGKLEEASEETSAMEFYKDVGQTAAQHGVTVSVITISGTDCKLVHLGQLADITGGKVNIVDPLKLREEFTNILADPIIATKVKATFLIYKDLYVVDETEPEKQECKAIQHLGNVTSSTVITFQFAHRSQEENFTTRPDVDKDTDTASEQGASNDKSDSQPPSDKQKDVPFQLQIEYVDQEGNKALRVITQLKQRTKDRQLAEQHANLDIVGAHAAKLSSNLALQGLYSRSRGVALMNQRLAWRSTNSETSTKEKKSKYRKIFSRLKTMENRLGAQQQHEVSVSGRTYSDEEEEDEGPMYFNACAVGPGQSSTTTSRKQLKKIHSSRASEMDDMTAQMIYSVGRNQPHGLTGTSGCSCKADEKKPSTNSEDQASGTSDGTEK